MCCRITAPIVCIGASNLDRKLRSLGPLALGTSNPARQTESFGGVARNIAENLARLGAPTSLITAVGPDASGRALLAHADEAGIDTRSVLLVDGAASGTYTAVLDEDGEMRVALADMAINDALTPAFFASRAAAARRRRADRGRPEPAAGCRGRAAGRRAGAAACRWSSSPYPNRRSTACRATCAACAC